MNHLFSQTRFRTKETQKSTTLMRQTLFQRPNGVHVCGGDLSAGNDRGIQEDASSAIGLTGCDKTFKEKPKNGLIVAGTGRINALDEQQTLRNYDTDRFGSKMKEFVDVGDACVPESILQKNEGVMALPYGANTGQRKKTCIQSLSKSNEVRISGGSQPKRHFSHPGDNDRTALSEERSPNSKCDSSDDVESSIVPNVEDKDVYVVSGRRKRKPSACAASAKEYETVSKDRKINLKMRKEARKSREHLHRANENSESEHPGSDWVKRGLTVEIYWPEEHKWYRGVVTRRGSDEYDILYMDGGSTHTHGCDWKIRPLDESYWRKWHRNRDGNGIDAEVAFFNHPHILEFRRKFKLNIANLLEALQDRIDDRDYLSLGRVGHLNDLSKGCYNLKGSDGTIEWLAQDAPWTPGWYEFRHFQRISEKAQPGKDNLLHSSAGFYLDQANEKGNNRAKCLTPLLSKDKGNSEVLKSIGCGKIPSASLLKFNNSNDDRKPRPMTSDRGDEASRLCYIAGKIERRMPNLRVVKKYPPTTSSASNESREHEKEHDHMGAKSNCMVCRTWNQAAHTVHTCGTKDRKINPESNLIELCRKGRFRKRKISTQWESRLSRESTQTHEISFSEGLQKLRGDTKTKKNNQSRTTLKDGNLINVTWSEKGTFRCHLKVLEGRMFVTSEDGSFSGFVPFDPKKDTWQMAHHLSNNFRSADNMCARSDKICAAETLRQDRSISTCDTEHRETPKERKMHSVSATSDSEKCRHSKRATPNKTYLNPNTKHSNGNGDRRVQDWSDAARILLRTPVDMIQKSHGDQGVPHSSSSFCSISTCSDFPRTKGNNSTFTTLATHEFALETPELAENSGSSSYIRKKKSPTKILTAQFDESFVLSGLWLVSGIGDVSGTIFRHEMRLEQPDERRVEGFTHNAEISGYRIGSALQFEYRVNGRTTCICQCRLDYKSDSIQEGRWHSIDGRAGHLQASRITPAMLLAMHAASGSCVQLQQ